MASNYKPLTSHSLPKAKAKTKVPIIPEIGQRVAFDSSLVSQDEEPGTQKLGTPMSKVRYFPTSKAWKQVGRHEAGMFVFFINEPEPHHTAFVIQSIIPTQTACYAKLE